MSFPEAWSEIRQVLADTGDAIKAREHGLHVAAAVRISVGIATSEQDIDRLVSFLGGHFYNCVASEANSRRGSTAGLSISALPTFPRTPPTGEEEDEEGEDSSGSNEDAFDRNVEVVVDKSMGSSPTSPKPTTASPKVITKTNNSHPACCIVM